MLFWVGMEVKGESDNGGVRGWELGLLYCPRDREKANPRRHGGWVGEEWEWERGERSKGNDCYDQDFLDLNQVLKYCSLAMEQRRWRMMTHWGVVDFFTSLRRVLC